MQSQSLGGFATIFARPPDQVGVAPGRVNLIGEHTDYNAGLCLPIALTRTTRVSVAGRSDDVLRVVSDLGGEWKGTLADLEPGRTSGMAAYVAAPLWAAREAGAWSPVGLDVYVESTVPLGAGLSSSAALICAVLQAVAGDHPRERQVEWSIRAETEGVGAPTGGLDQTVAVLAEPGQALRLDFQDGSVGPVPWLPERAGLVLMVVDTRVSHSHADGGYGQRRTECEEAARLLGVGSLREASDLSALSDPVLLRRARHVVSEIERVERTVAALAAEDWLQVGTLFTASHASLRDDFEVSAPELDAVVEVALGQGALGARMTGGGFGGSAIALVPLDRLEETTDAVLARFEAEGWSAPEVFTTDAGPGARRTAG